MARIRTIKPEFFTSEQIVECSPIARVLFIGLWCWCDDAGIHPASYKRLKMEVFPGDDYTLSDIKTWIAELKENALIREYVGEDSQRYWIVTGWKHQKIDRPSYKYPAPNEHTEFDERSPIPIQRSIDERSPPEGKGRESKGSISCAKSLEERFARFWKAYPRKKSKQAAVKIWERLKPSEQLKATIIEAVERAKTSRDWKKQGGEFIPYPASWLNAGGWEDEVQPGNGLNGARLDECSDDELTAVADELGVATHGKLRDELIRDIRAKLDG